MLSSAKQFSAQFAGLLLAVLISVLVSHRLGATEAADAFLMGRRLVTGLQELLAQVLVLVFIPMVAARSGWQPLLRLGVVVAAAGMGCAALFAVLAGPVTTLIAPDMNPEAQVLAARVIRILAMSLPLALLGVLAGAALNVQGAFGWPALARLLPRIGVLVCFLFAAQEALVGSAAYAFVAGNAAALALMVLVMGKAAPTGAATARPQIFAALLLVAGGQAALWLETALAARAGAGGVTLLEMGQRIGALLGNTLALALIMPAFAKWTAEPARRTPQALVRMTVAGGALLVLTQGMIAWHGARIVQDLLGNGAFDAGDQARLLPVLWMMVLPPFATLVMRGVVVWLLTRAKGGAALWVALGILADLGLRAAVGVAGLDVLGVSAVAAGMVLGPLAAAAVMWMGCRSDMAFDGVRDFGPLKVVVGAALAGLAFGILSDLALGLVWTTQGAPVAAGVRMVITGLMALLVFAALVKWRGAVSMFRF